MGVGNGVIGAEKIPYFPLFPRAQFTLVVGDPGVGKSLLGAHLVARESVRSPMMPDKFVSDRVGDEVEIDSVNYEERPGVSVLCSREDDSRTLGMRLSVAAEGEGVDERFVRTLGALSLVPPPVRRRWSWSSGKLIDEREPEKIYSPLMLALRGLVEKERLKVRLVVLDPLPGFLEMLDASNNAALIRRALEPLLDFADGHGMRVVGITHLAKGRGRSALFSAVNSFAYTALARSVVVMTRVAGDAGRRMLVPVKNNFALPTHAYYLKVESVPMDAEKPDGLRIPYVKFEGTGVGLEDERVAAALGNASLDGAVLGAERDLEMRGRVDFAVEFLRTVLGEGAVESVRVAAEARSVGISRATLWRAQEVARVRSYREGARWWMEMAGSGEEEFCI